MRPGKGLAIGRTTLLLLFGVLLLAGLGLTYGLSPVIRASLIDGLPKSTRGLYRFESLKVRVRPFLSSIELTDVHIKTDSAAFARLGATESAPATRWEAIAPSIYIRLSQPWRIWMGQPVRIAEIRAEKPVIRLSYERAEGKSRPFTGQFRQMLQQLVTARGGLSIDRFVLDGGELQFNNNRKFSRDAFIARDLHAEVLGFDLDSQTIKRLDRPFRVREFQADVSVEDYSFVLPDSTYEIKAGRIGFSSKDGELFASNVHVRPNYRFIQGKSAKERPTVVELTVTQVGLGGMDIKRWLETRYLHLGSIRFEHPHVVLVQGADHSAPRLSPEILYKNLQSVAQAVEIGGIAIEQGQFTRINQIGNIPADIQVDGIGAYLKDIVFDSLRLVNGQIWSGSMEVKTGAFSFQTESGSISGTSGYLSTPEKRLTLTGLRANSRPGNVPGRAAFQLEATSAGAEGIPFKDLMKGRFRQTDKIWIRGLGGIFVAPDSSRGPVRSGPFAMLDSVFAIRNLEISAGHLRLASADGHAFVQTGKLRLLAKALSLRPGTYPLAKSFALDTRIDSAAMFNPEKGSRLHIRGADLASASGDLRVDEVLFSKTNPDQPTRNLQVTAPDVYVHGLDAFSLVFGRKIHIDSARISHARVIPPTPEKKGLVTLDSFSLPDPGRWLEGWADTLHIRKAAVTDLRIGSTDSLPPVNLRLEAVNWVKGQSTDPETHWFAQKTRFSLGKGRIGTTTLDSLEFSLENHHVEVFGLSHSDSSMEVNLPFISLNGWNWPLFLKHQQIKAQSLRIAQPVVSRMAIENLTKGGKSRSETWRDLQRIAASCQLDTLRIESGTAKLTPPGMPDLQTRKIQVVLSSVLLDSSTWAAEKTGLRFGSLSLGLEMDKYSWFLPDSNYQISIGKIGFSSTSSFVQAADIELSPRPGADFEGLNAQWHIKAPELSIQGLNMEDLLNRKGIRMQSLGIDRPEIRWKVLQEEGQPLEEALTAAFQPILNRWGAISIDGVKVLGASLVREFGFETDKKPAVFSGLSLRLAGFAPDRQEAFRPGRYLYSKEIEILLSRYVLDIQKGDYTGTVYNLEYRSATKKMHADSFVVRPVLRLFDYYLRKKYVVDDLVAQLRDISLNEVQGLALLTRGAIRGHKLTVGDLRLSIERDRRFDQKPDRRPPMPQDLLRKAIMPIVIDSVVFPRARIAYAEMVPYWSTAGIFVLDSLRLTLANITNVAPDNPQAMLHAHGLLMGKTPLVLDGQFSLGDTLNTYMLSGKVGSMPLVYLNPILGTAARIQMRQGICQGIEFTYNGNSREVTGRMRFLYTGMKLDIYDNRGGKQEIESSRKFLSALANSLVVRQNNPNNKWLRVGRIRYTTEPFRFITGHWLKAFAQGALSSMGIGSKGERDEILNPKDREPKEKK